MTPRFKRWFTWLMEWEGTVYENDPDDPGGATKYGIDQRSHPGVNIKALTQDQAADIYLNEAWHRVHAEELPPGIGEVLANITVNCGYGSAVKWLQECIHTPIDGTFGPQTLRLTQLSDPVTLTYALLGRTAQHYQAIAKGHLSKYLKGWLNRNNSLRDLIHA